MKGNKVRCAWAESDPLFFPYHDQEWGVPMHDDRMLFEMLNLESAQAGLSWLTILKKRGTYREAFDNFDASKIAKYDEVKRAELLKDKGIIRNRLKVNAFVENALVYLKVKDEFGSFDVYIWQFVDGKPMQGDTERAAAQGISNVMSIDMKKRGFRFVGPTILYAFMQAVGMVNDHEVSCFRFDKTGFAQPESLFKPSDRKL
jgi:DNA-3-methyladenine glycosylase I